MLFAVLLRGEAGELFERAREMTLRRKAEIEKTALFLYRGFSAVLSSLFPFFARSCLLFDRFMLSIFDKAFRTVARRKPVDFMAFGKYNQSNKYKEGLADSNTFQK